MEESSSGALPGAGLLSASEDVDRAISVGLQQGKMRARAALQKVLVGEALNVMHNALKSINGFRPVVGIENLLQYSIIMSEDLQLDTIITGIASIITADKAAQLVKNGLIRSREVVASLMQPYKMWRETVRKRGCLFLPEDVLVLVIKKEDFLKVCQLWMDEGKVLEGIYYEMWAALTHGNYGEFQSPFFTTLFGTRDLGYRFFYGQIMGNTDPFLERLLKASSTVLLVNVAGIAIALMAGISEVLNTAVLVLSADWVETDSGGYLGECKEATCWVTKVGTVKEWIVLQYDVNIGGTRTTRNVCLAVLFMAIRCQWWVLNIKTVNTCQTKIAEGCTYDITRLGDMLPAIGYRKFRKYLVMVVDKLTNLPSGCDGDNLAEFFEVLTVVIMNHCGDLNCQKYYDRLGYMNRLLNTKTVGVAVLTWYLESCNQSGASLVPFQDGPVYLSRPQIGSLITAVKKDDIPYSASLVVAALEEKVEEEETFIKFRVVMAVFYMFVYSEEEIEEDDDEDEY